MRDPKKKLARLQAKRWKKKLYRKFVIRVRHRMFHDYGTYLGEQMYRTWRGMQKGSQ